MAGNRILNYLALIAAVSLLLWTLRTLWRDHQLRGRPLLLAGCLLGALPTLYAAAVWTGWLPESYLRFSRPWLAPLGMLAMLWVAWRLLIRRGRWGAWRTHLSDAFIAATVMALGLAALEVEWGRPLDRLTVVMVVDRSRSIDLVPNATRDIQAQLAAAESFMKEDDLIARVVFGAVAASEQPPRHKKDITAPQRADIGRDSSDIAAGIRRALAEVPADSAARIVLVSDGVATRGDALAAAAAAVAADIPIDVFTLEQQGEADLHLVSVRLPARSREREIMPLRVVISSPEDTEIEIRVKRDGQLIRRARARVKKGEDVLRLREPAAGAGLHRYDVEISALDPRVDNNAEDNAQTAFVRVSGPALALVIDGDASKTAFIAGALREVGFNVTDGGPGAFPTEIGELARYDLLIFGDLPARFLSTTQLENIGSYVRDLGGGLILMGGDRSMGPGGYAKTPVEEVSPVSFDLKQQRRRASLAEVIAIDISGSMAMQVHGKTKLALANEAAARSAALLGPGDRVGVLHVDTVPNWSVPLAPVTDKKAIENAIFAVGPGGGGIYVDVALREAYAALRSSVVNLKHVLLFADGADAEHIDGSVVAATTAALRAGITTSCIALGRGSDLPALEDLAKRGGGRFYIVEDASRLPAVFAEETVLASRSALVEEPFEVALASSHPSVRGVDFSAAPKLDGYVVTIAKPRSTILLTGPEDDPILAWWAVGVGKSAVFTSDLKDRWGSRWTGWPGAAQMLAQTARFIARSEDDANVQLQAHATAGQLHVRATVVDDDGRLQSFRRLHARVAGPNGFAREVALEATGPGSYTAVVPLPHPGSFIVAALDGDDPTHNKVIATTGAALSAGEEMRATGSDHALLSRVTKLTGGQLRADLKTIFQDRARHRFAYRDITLWLLVFAACTLLLSVAARRLALPFDKLAKLAAAMLPGHRVATSRAGDAADATLTELLQRRASEPVAPRIAAATTTTTTTAAGAKTDADAADEPQDGMAALAKRRAERRTPPVATGRTPPKPTPAASGGAKQPPRVEPSREGEAADGGVGNRSAAEKLLDRRRRRRD